MQSTAGGLSFTRLWRVMSRTLVFNILINPMRHYFACYLQLFRGIDKIERKILFDNLQYFNTVD